MYYLKAFLSYNKLINYLPLFTLLRFSLFSTPYEITSLIVILNTQQIPLLASSQGP